MLADLVRFQREARALLAAGDDGPSLGDWLEEHRYSRAFVERLIVPQAAAVWSADPRQMWSFPARFLLEFFDNHGMLGLRDRPQWRTVAGRLAPLRRGAHRAAGATRLRLAHAGARDRAATTTTSRSRRAAASPSASTRSSSPRTPTRRWRCSPTPRDREHELLGAIPYQPNEAVLHTDARAAPAPPARVGELELPPARRADRQPTVTYHMNRLQSLRAEREFCVTLNRTEAIDPDKVIRTIPYAHPVFTAEGQAAQARHDEISGADRTHYCGAYWGWGFHEDGVVSARARRASARGGEL